MLHLWSLATWGMDITHDAGKPEWIDAPGTGWTIDDLSTSAGHTVDDKTWTIRLPETMYLLTAWYMDELCEHLYVTCLDPRGKTVWKLLDEIEVEENIPRLNIAAVPLSHLWYTVDGLYTFTFAYFYGGLPINILARFVSC